MQKHFKKAFEQEEDFVPAFHLNGFDKPMLPVISNEDSALIQLYRWRLVPQNITDENDFKANTLNARAEDLFQTASYKDAWQNRCLVICTGFYEPHKAIGSGKSQSYYIQPKEAEFFTLAALWSKWQGLYTCSIITVAASPLMEEIHNDGKRMPLILDNDASQKWLEKDISQDEMKLLFQQLISDEQIEAYRVMDEVLNARKNTNIPEAILPIKASGQISLF